MGAASAITDNFAKNRGGGLCTSKTDFVHLNESLATCAKAVFVKPCTALMQMLNLCERDAKYRLSAKRKFTAAEIAALLQSEEGIHFLVVLMDKKRPAWWKAILKMGILGTVEARRRADAELLAKVFHADADATTGFTAAFRAQDPVFYGAVLAGHDEATSFGSQSGPVGKGRRR